MMKRIDDILQLADKCTGCMACVDACPANCISSMVGKDGFLYSAMNETACIRCGKCYGVCPIENAEKHEGQQSLFAACQADDAGRNRGSSGGMFELLAEHCLQNGYYVCAAAFDGTTLHHRIIKDQQELGPLLKSKYLQSNMEGIYAQLVKLLQKGENVFFCGTPCQVSALVNMTPPVLRENLFTADIVCHGVPSQKMFDSYIQTLEKKHAGHVTDYTFRVKDNRYRHPHGFTYRVEKGDQIREFSGIYSYASFYNAFKSYSIFRNGCYDCQYTTLDRVSDITLADFWGIEKYDFPQRTDGGVSMVITNTAKGRAVFEAVRDDTVSKEFPLQYGVESNHCLTHCTEKPQQRDAIIRDYAEHGYEQVAKAYFQCSVVHRFWWWLPARVRNALRKARGR